MRAQEKKGGARMRLGRKGEDIAVAWLEGKGMQILERNYRCPLGEIDIVGMIDGAFVFVEVRSRSSAQWGTPAESVTYGKKRKLRKVAAYYLQQKKRMDAPCRFDVVGILYGAHGAPDRIEWIPDAF